jgi:hypothetical protein
MKAHRAFLRKMGFNANSGNAVMYGPQYLGGEALFHLCDDQGYGQVKLFIKFWRSKETETGIFLRITMTWAQYTVGTSVPIFSETKTKLVQLEAKWLASLRQYLHDVEGTIELDDDWVAPLQREHDAFIMDIAMASGNLLQCKSNE